MWKKPTHKVGKVPSPHKIIEVKVDEIYVPIKDYPPSGSIPPDNEPFKKLMTHLQIHGIHTPIFINKDKNLLQGHYRFWAWKAIGREYIPAVMVHDEKDIEWHLRYFFGREE